MSNRGGAGPLCGPPPPIVRLCAARALTTDPLRVLRALADRLAPTTLQESLELGEQAQALRHALRPLRAQLHDQRSAGRFLPSCNDLEGGDAAAPNGRFRTERGSFRRNP